MTYNPNIPIGAVSPQNQVPAIQTNFSQFNSIFEKNHTSINTTNQGDHERIILEIQNSDPDLIGNINILYAKNATSKAGTQPQLFFKIPIFLPTMLDPSTPGNLPMQLTYNSINTTGPVYQSFLPGGYIFYFGSTTNIAVNIILSPVPTIILMAIAYPNTKTTAGTPIPFNVSTQIISNMEFKINSTLGTTPYSFTWMAIAQA